MNMSKSNVALGVLTSVVTASAILLNYKNKRNFKKESRRWQDLYYNKLTQDDIAWG